MNSSSNKAFVKSFVGNVGAIVSSVAQKAVAEAYNHACFRSPVWSGQLIASWNISVKEPNYKVVYHPATEQGTVRMMKPKNPLEQKPLSQAVAEAKFQTAKAFDTYYVANGHKYAFGVDQGVEPYSGEANHMIKHAVDAAIHYINTGQSSPLVTDADFELLDAKIESRTRSMKWDW